ncbi:translation elongation factor Ts [Candidatus Parcubacteria bacterium]|nr:translation elongation factor Ts [Candidatus Parcubacteria bacterium]
MEKIKQLRDMTGAGIGDCKKALDESNGDLNKAVEYLRKKGGLKAAKKANRETNEGVVALGINDDKKKISIVKIACETDFVARNQDFKDFVQKVAEMGLANSAEDYFNSKKAEMTLKVAENLIFSGGEKMEGEYVSGYIHANAKIGVVVVFDKEVDTELANGIAMHIAAMNPIALNPENISEDVLEKEKEIYRVQLEKEGKPSEMIDKILIGKINKYYEEVCLTKQGYIMEDKKKVEEMLGDVKIVKFIRFAL